MWFSSSISGMIIRPFCCIDFIFIELQSKDFLGSIGILSVICFCGRGFAARMVAVAQLLVLMCLQVTFKNALWPTVTNCVYFIMHGVLLCLGTTN